MFDKSEAVRFCLKLLFHYVNMEINSSHFFTPDKQTKFFLVLMVVNLFGCLQTSMILRKRKLKYLLKFPLLFQTELIGIFSPISIDLVRFVIAKVEFRVKHILINLGKFYIQESSGLYIPNLPP